MSMGKLSGDHEPLASVANGLGPLSLLQTQWNGLRSNALRGGPLDKKGAGIWLCRK